jgi:PEP-CTERM motif
MNVSPTLSAFHCFRKLGVVALFLAVLFLVLPAPARADGLLWTITPNPFDDGGSLSGSFSFDDVTTTYGSINVTTTAGSLLGGQHYHSLTDIAPSDGTTLVLGPHLVLDLTGDNFLELLFDGALTNLGGSVGFFGVEFHCTDTGCSDPLIRQTLNEGTVTGGVVAAPEPSPLILLGSGLLGLLAARRRKRS